MGRTPCCTKEGMNKGAWTALEDKLLTSYIKTHGEGKWRDLPAKAGLKRCGKSCRLRWLNYLRPDIKRGSISEQEEDLIVRLHKLLGNRWSLIAGRLPGRTDNEIKNYWNTILRKKVKGTTSSSTTSKSQSNHYSSDDLDNENTTKTQTTTNCTKRQSLQTNKTQVVQRTRAVRTKALKCTGMANRAQENHRPGTSSTPSVSDHESPALVQDLEINHSSATNYTFDTFWDFDFDFDLDFWALCNAHDQFDISTGVDDNHDDHGKNNVPNDASDDCKWASTSYAQATLSSDQGNDFGGMDLI